MMMARRAALVAMTLAVALLAVPQQFAASTAALPSQLRDAEFWRLVDELSEPAGFFNSDNLVSNEDTFQHVIPELRAKVAPGGVYVGVGPDQNFTYIAAVQPAVAFIPDLRRGNLHVHLLYKALFALSADRAEFLSRLFSRPKPANVSASASARDVMAAFATVTADPKVYDTNLRAVFEEVGRHRGKALEPDDRAGIEFVYNSFFAEGPDLAFVSQGGFRRSRYPSYAEIQAQTDAKGVERSYLASEVLFQRVKTMQARNLVVPIVGDFAGSRALRNIGKWVREQGGTVTTFYTSNVEQYLFRDGAWHTFRANVETMPLDATSTFIRSCFNTCSSPGGSRAVTLLDSMRGLIASAASGRIMTYWDVLTHSTLPAP